jgi:ribosomal protein L13E
MQSYYEKLVEEKGKTVANEYMRQLRYKRKVNKGGGFNLPEVRAKALETRRKNAGDKKKQPYYENSQQI